MSPLFLPVSHNMQTFISTAACYIILLLIFKTHHQEHYQHNSINMSNKDDDIDNREHTEEISAANSNIDHCITGAPEEQDILVSSDTNDVYFFTNGSTNIPGLSKTTKLSHPMSSISSDRRHNSFHHNANVNLSIISSIDNFLLRQGIVSDSLALFQQEDSNPVNTS